MISRRLSTISLAALLLAPLMHTTGLRAQDTAEPVMSLVVDESRAAQRIVSVHEELTVQPGVLELAYPKWIPGEHGPTGPIEQVAAVQMRAGQTPLAWTRDPEDLFSFHVTVPGGTTRIAIDFQVLLQNTISDHQLLLAWNRTVLYPRHIDKQRLLIQPAVVLPAGWKQASSLRVVSAAGGRVDFAPVSLERLIDSPVLASEFLRTVTLPSSWPAMLHVTGDTQSAIDRADDAHAFRIFGSLVDQDRAMFGFRHFQTLHVLVAQSDAVFLDGLEHGDSPFNAIGDAGLSKSDELAKFGVSLLAHEQSHSWVGKYRRAAEMYSRPDYQGPERTSLLWVYEGLNQYIGLVLATRSGMNDAAYARDNLAGWAAFMAYSPGRAFTTVADTATQNWVLRSVDNGWRSLRRSQDYYIEGALMWLEADAIIRRQSGGRQSLEDFLRSFFGQRDTDPIVVTYTREELEAALAAVSPYDWHGFIESRIYAVNAAPPTKGLEAAGWRLVYNDVPNADRFMPPWWSPQSVQAFTIGAYLRNDGTIEDVVPGSPADKAGVGPLMSLVSVDGRAFSLDRLIESIAHPSGGRISVGVKNFDSVKTHEIRYEGGLRYPHLEAIPGSHDYLTEILAARPVTER
jgi:predicted metalloprotease with PDZ domain